MALQINQLTASRQFHCLVIYGLLGSLASCGDSPATLSNTADSTILDQIDFEVDGDIATTDATTTWTAAEPCDSNADCTGQECSSARRICVECIGNADCVEGSICIEGSCGTGIRCKSDADCKTINSVCDQTGELCVDCLVDSDCGPGTSCEAHHCEVSKNCSTSKECDHVCDKAKGRCVECTTNADCSPTEACESNRCHARVCVSGACGGGKWFPCSNDGASYQPGLSCDDTDQCTQDACQSGVGCVHTKTGIPGGTEFPADGIDNDCNGLTDETVPGCAASLGTEATQLVAAVDICSPVSATFTAIASTGAAWSLSELAGVLPMRGDSLAALSTGLIAKAGEVGFEPPDVGTDFHLTMAQDSGFGCSASKAFDMTIWSASFVAPQGAQSLVLHWRIATGENDYENFDDGIYVGVASKSWSGNVALAEDGSCFSVSKAYTCSSCTSADGKSFGYSKATKWREVAFPVTAGEPVVIKAAIFDRGDGLGDTILLLDDFRWSGKVLSSAKYSWVDDDGATDVPTDADATSSGDSYDSDGFSSGDSNDSTGSDAQDGMGSLGDTSGSNMCLGTPDCQLAGKCSLLNGVCGVGSDADCKACNNCKELGLCTDVGGACVAANQEDCQKSSFCSFSGLCSLKDGKCQLLSSDDCKLSDLCKSYGRCTLVGSLCLPASDADCAKSSWCAKQKFCTFKNNKCCNPNGACL